MSFFENSKRKDNKDFKRVIEPVESFFSLDVEQLYYSDEIILGYLVRETILPRKGESLKDLPKAHYDKKPDHYIVKDFYVKRVLKGNKYFEGKIMKFVEYPWFYKEYSGRENVFVNKEVHNPPSIKVGEWQLLLMKEIVKKDKTTDENYTGPYAYDAESTRISRLRAHEEPVIRMYLKRAASSSYPPPAKRVYLDRPD